MNLFSKAAYDARLVINTSDDRFVKSNLQLIIKFIIGIPHLRYPGTVILDLSTGRDPSNTTEKDSPEERQKTMDVLYNYLKYLSKNNVANVCLFLDDSSPLLEVISNQN